MSGQSELIVRTIYADTVGDTELLDELLARRRIDLAKPDQAAFAGALIIGQCRALEYLGDQIDKLRDEVAELRRAG